MGVDDNIFLELDRTEMEALGQKALGHVLQHYCDLREEGVVESADLKGDWRPEAYTGDSVARLIERVVADVFGNIAHLDHPRFCGFVPGPSNYIGFLADVLVAGFNPFAGSWLEASGPARIESEMVAFLARQLRLPETSEGVFVSGGTMANLHAVALAREWSGDSNLEGTAYLSRECHSSVAKVIKLLGYRESRIRTIDVDSRGRMQSDGLERALELDRDQGRKPFLVVGTCGTTGTGAVDPLTSIRRLCNLHGAWMHVDGAYGASVAISDELRHILSGVELADSVSVDAHKWLFQPYECSCVLTRHAGLLEQAFGLSASYLTELELLGDGVDFFNRGVQMSRSFRALKLWMTIRAFGAGVVASAVEKGVRLADYAETRIAQSKVFSVVTPASLGIVTFRVNGVERVEESHRRAVQRLAESGRGFISTTVVDSLRVLRMCIINPRTTKDDIDEVLGFLERAVRG